MSDPKVSITGPIDSAGNVVGFETKLYTAEQASANTDTKTNSQDIAGESAEESIVSPLEAEREFDYDGVVSSEYLVREGFGSTQKEAVRQYVFELESLVLAQQDSGYKLVDEVNGITRDPTQDIGVLVEEISWTLKEGDNLRVEWRMSVIQSGGVQPDSTARTRSEYITEQERRVQQNADNTLVYSGNNELTLGFIEDLKLTRKIEINSQQLLHNTEAPQTGVIESGEKESVNVSGVVTDEEVSGTLPDWARESNIDAHGEPSSLTESFTGRTFDGTLESTKTDVEAGRPRGINYDIEFKVGAADLFA